MQEEINICVCCQKVFEGKSIGPHYKNSSRCAEFKRAKDGKKKPGLGESLLKVEAKSIKMEAEAPEQFSVDDVDAYFESF